MNPSWLKNHDVRSFAFKPIIVRTYCVKTVCDVAIRLTMRELLFESFFMIFTDIRSNIITGLGNVDLR